MSEKIIKFRTVKEILNSKSPPPVPMSKIIPEWYKKMHIGGRDTDRKTPVYSLKGRLFRDGNIKSCIPVRDYLTCGYAILTSQDIAVEAKVIGDGAVIDWVWRDDVGQYGHLAPAITSHTKDQVEGSPIEKEIIQDRIFKYNTNWKVQTPKGYSCLILPIEYQECPFHALPAIVDTDEFHDMNFPFRFRGKEGSYTIPAGTPVVQIVPFKRENWEMELTEWTQDDDWAHKFTLVSKYYQMYKNLFHKRKTYR
jgi:hypothetical protein|tara:strand:- start:484 stop:1239 length:756 start_codon:yes stop_codon:yes gene_type:complete